MAIDYQAVLRRRQIKAALGPEQFAEAFQDEEFLGALICDEGVSVLSLGFNTGSVNWIQEWNGLFFFFSSDLDCEGPFKTLDEALALEVFHWPNPYASELHSDRLPLKRLMELARDLVTDDDESI